MNIKKLEEIKTALSKILEIEKVEFKQTTTEAGQILEWESDNPIPEVGEMLYIGGEERTVAEAGEYVILNDVGEKVVVTVGEDGKVLSAEVASEVEEDEPIEEPEDENPIEAEDEDPADEPLNEPEPTEEPEVIEDTTKELEAEIEALKAEIEALKAENEELKARIAELEAEPQVEPVEQQFEAMVKKQKQSGALKYAQALKK